jgi:[protein-PII] uridylyltransferase
MRSSYLDARLVWGCPALHNSFLAIRQSLPPAENAAIISQLLAESSRRDNAGAAHSASEPNLKSGPGALRDIQCLRWLTQLRRSKPICGSATLTQISAAARCLSRVRCFLHLLTARPQDRLTRDLQAQVARQLGLAFADEEAGERELLALVRHHTSLVRKVVRLCQQTEFLAANCA